MEGNGGAARGGGLDFGRVKKGLHDNAELLGFFVQGGELFRSGAGGSDVEVKANAFKADRHVFGNAKRAAQIQVAIDSGFDLFRWDTNGCSDHLTGDLRAGRESAEKQIA